VVAKLMNGNVTMVIASTRTRSVMVKLNALMDLMRPKPDAATKVSKPSLAKSVAATQIPNGLVQTVTVFHRTLTVMVKLNALIDLMKEMTSAASENSLSIMTNVVAARIINGNAKTVNVSMLNIFVMSNIIAKINLMKFPKSVDVMRRPRSNVITVTALRKSNTVMVKLNAKIAPMKEMRDAASRSSHSTTIKDVDVSTHKSSVPMVIVSPRKISAMVKPNAVMDLMKEIRNAASRSSLSTTPRNAAATQKLSLLVPTATVSPMMDTVMVNPSAEINLMKEKTSAVSESTLTTTFKSVAATLILNTPVTMVNVFLRTVSVTVKPYAPMDPMKVTNNVASESSLSMMMPDVAAKRTNSNVPTRNALAKPTFVMVKLNAPMVLMNLITNVALESSLSMTTKNVVANQDLSIHALMATVLQ